MAEPAVGTGIRIDAIAGAKNPEALACLILDDKVIAHGLHLGVVLPPLAKNTFRAIGTLDLAAFAAPDDRPGGRSGISAIASITSGRASSRTGRRQ